ncbi:phosphate ABC transporter substrate-binding protein [Fusobacterium sp.]|uniref:phosphate ABC transporter substrate-binding protein n=1 Tax=Fusobacterium sp. TaxID=68766 RepID=UPI00396CC2C6
MKNNFWKKGILTALIFAGTVGFGQIAQGRSKIVQLKGSDTILNASQAMAEKFMVTNKGARIAVTGGGSGVGISSLINKTTDIAMASRNMKAKEYDQAKAQGINIDEIVVGYDGITIIANKSNPIKDIDDKTLGKVFRGEITNWKELGGEDAEIVVLSRDSSSGTHEFFKEHIIREGNANGTQEYGAKTLYMPSNQAIKQEVTNNKNAIGYIGMGYMDDSVEAIKVDGVPATRENVLSKSYPIAREVYWYTTKERDGVVKDLVDFAVSPDGQAIMQAEGFVPVK